MVVPQADGYGLASELRQVGQRLAGLLETAEEEPDFDSGRARLILQEMATGMEELRVAEEELTVQAEQLLVSHAAIDRERERYAELFEFAPDAYLETDALGKIVEANGTAERLLGVPLRYLSGKLVQSFIVAGDMRSVRNVLNDLGEAAGPPRTIEVDLCPRELPPVQVEARVASRIDPAHGETGEVRLLWLLRDITERRKLDRKLEQLHTEVELLEALAEVNRLAIEIPDPESPMLEALVELAVRISGAAEAGITLTDAKDRVEARAVSSELGRRLCDIQVDDGGPVFEVLRDGKPRLDLVGDAGPWTGLRKLLAEHELQWVFTHPIPMDGATRGTFALFGRGPAEPVRHELEILTANASRVLANGRLYRSARELGEHLATALESRGVIEQAKGILMAWQGCGPDRAFDILRRASQRENRKLRVVAEDIVARASRDAKSS